MLKLWAAIVGAFCLLACGRGPTYPSPEPDRPLQLGVCALDMVPPGHPFSIVRYDYDRVVPGVNGYQKLIILGTGGTRHEQAAQRAEELNRQRSDAWLEPWNEPSLEQFWGTTPDPAGYVQVVKDVKLAAPGMFVLGPSTSGHENEWPFVEECARLGLGQWIDAVSFHGYSVGDPSQLGPSIARLRRLFPGKRIYITEWGNADGTEQDQADFARRAIHFADQEGVEALVWYEFQDREVGRPFGLFDANGRPRLAYRVFQEAARR